MSEISLSDLCTVFRFALYSESAFIRVNPRLILICDPRMRHRNKTLSDRCEAESRFRSHAFDHFSSLD